MSASKSSNTSIPRPSHVPGGQVISYFNDFDGQFNSQKIGYDVTKFTEAVKKFVVPGVVVKDTPTPSKSEALTEEQQKTVAEKSDIEMVAKQFLITNKEAEHAIKKAQGDVVTAMVELTTNAPRS